MSNAKSKSDSFILDLQLKVSPSQEKILLVRLDCARQLYNAVLSEALSRLKLMRESKAYQVARMMPKIFVSSKPSENNKVKVKEINNPERAQTFKDLNKKFEFNEYSLHAFAAITKNACHIGDHLDINTCQKIATRVWSAVQQFAFGKRGKPRFKGWNQFDSVEGKTNTQGIKWRENQVVWSGLKLPALFDPKDKYGVQAHGLDCPTKYVRIVRRKLAGQNRFYVQLVQEGRPKRKEKNKIGETVVGLDLGPSTIAAVSVDDAFLGAFCAQLEPIQKEVRRIQRRLNRSRRAFNPEAFNSNGTIKKGVRLKKSNAYRQDKVRLEEVSRRLAAYRKALQGQMANRVLTMGKFINLEKLSYRAWQRMFGKSVGFRAPGMFVSMLRRKAESAGGVVNEFPVRNRLSQTCHQCGTAEKKALSKRWHHCDCGIHAQRDLYSAFLAMNVVGDDLDMRQAVQAWPGAEPLLCHAMSRCDQTMIGEVRFASFGLNRSRNGLHGEEGSVQDKAEDVVACLGASESFGESCSTAFRT
ncbi:MAG: transposase, partial [Candidatus Omnitrophica bacterium]|nr:transposase [Candidatus Omnitrophota bacterium]